MLTVVRPLANAVEVERWARAVGFDNTVPANWHVTIVKTSVGFDLGGLVRDGSELVVPASSNRLIGRMGGTIGLMFRSGAIESRHRAFRMAGADWEHHDFRSHVTLAVDDRRSLDAIEPFEGELVFGGEVWSPVPQEPAPSVLSQHC